MAACRICDDLLLRFTEPTTTHDIALGSFDDANRSTCPNHTPLFREFVDYCGTHSAYGDTTDDVGIGKGYKNHSVSLYESLGKLGATWSLLLENRSDIPHHAGTGRVLDPSWIDLDLVKKWKQKCLSEHGSKCHNPTKVPLMIPAWLVDTDKKCIVPGSNQGSYVALSYCWGDTSGKLRLDMDLLAKLQQPGSLEEPAISCRLPLMIKHAMSLTSIIGERYLWVDAFCIVHGGHVSTAEQLNLMSAIYASAIVTIVAADGHSSDGLLGIEGISPPRNLEQRVIPFGDEKLIVRNTNIFSMGSGTEYYNRAWTYQEYKMSPRKLLFNRKEVHWECQCSVWHEELTLGTEIDKYIDSRLGVILAGFPDLGSLSHMIGDYNQRKLTYAEDALSGIAGLLSVASRSFTGGFLYGCPETFFDRALGWQPQWNHTNLLRRAPSERPPAHRLSPTTLPSWSWIGWQGMITLHYGEASRINDRLSWIEETHPITEWYTSSDPGSQSRRRIRSTWFENRDDRKCMARDRSKPLLDGWTRYEAGKEGTFRGEPRLYPDRDMPGVYKHTSMPDDDCQEWYYPFPVAEISESTPLFTPEQTPYLFCKTKNARVYAERVDYMEFPDGAHNLILRDENNIHIIGRLHLANDEQMEQWPEVKTRNDQGQGKPIEVVAIYETTRYSKTFNEEAQRYDHPLVREARVTVLWVEWKDGVAYRLACGYVTKDAWEQLHLEGIDLVLG